MRAVLQRCISPASVEAEGTVTGEIQKGLVILLGVEDGDNSEDLKWLARKIINLRIFADEDGKMNRSLKDVGGEVLLISQFTLHAQLKKGNRPSFVRAAPPGQAEKMYKDFAGLLRELYDIRVAEGLFGAHMKVKLENDGPVTIIIDSKNKDL